MGSGTGGPGPRTALVLAGGLGTRLAPVLGGRPKVMAEIAGRPFLAFLLDRLAREGVADVVVCSGYLGDQIAAAIGHRHRGMRIAYSHETTPLGTGGALRHALALVGDETVLALNGDSLSRASLRRLWAWHRARGAEATLLLTRVADATRFGRVELARSGRVVRFEEKAPGAGPAWISAGVYVLTRRLLADIPPDRPVSLEHEVLPAWIGRGLYGWPSDGAFLDIGTPEDFAAAGAFVGAAG
jgi:D-glycero-alpha-D-manno-heptose 1-phosphate guanylyltransferase